MFGDEVYRRINQELMRVWFEDFTGGPSAPMVTMMSLNGTHEIYHQIMIVLKQVAENAEEKDAN